MAQDFWAGIGFRHLARTADGALAPTDDWHRLVVSNGFGVVTSTVVSLTVVEPIIISQPASRTVAPGENVVFDVLAVGTEPLSYRWLKNDAPVSEATGPTLTVTNAQAAEAGGAFQVVVSNVFGSVTSSVAKLTVNLAVVDSFSPGANNYVYSTAVQTDGKILYGGLFTQPRNYIARLNADGSFDTTFASGAN